MEIVPIILCGGKGTRLWPLTGADTPKAMLELPSGRTFLHETLKRAKSVASFSSDSNSCILSVLQKDHLQLSLGEYEKAGLDELDLNFLVEPFARDTAPAITLAALELSARGQENAIMLILPCDHVIEDNVEFENCVQQSMTMASKGNLVSIGVKPSSPNTAYGYLKTNGQMITEFIEKPNLEKARQYFNDSKYFWNSGMFCCKVSVLLKLMGEHCSDVLDQCNLALGKINYVAQANKKIGYIDEGSFNDVVAGSIDNLLLSKLNNTRFVEGHFRWSDVGSWDAYSKLLTKDVNGNFTSNLGFAEDSDNCLAFTHDRPIAMVGLTDIIVVDSDEGILVANKNAAQGVRSISEKLHSLSTTENVIPFVEARPWGKFEVLHERENCKVKRLIVNPKQSLSLQSHEHRSEHWVIAEGVAEVRLGNEIKSLNEGDTIEIPIGAKHRVMNPSTDRLVIIETQLGSYLGEDDQVRYEDEYGRETKL